MTSRVVTAANKKLQDRVPGAGVYINAQLHRCVTALTALQAAAQVHRLTENNIRLTGINNNSYKSLILLYDNLINHLFVTEGGSNEPQ